MPESNKIFRLLHNQYLCPISCWRLCNLNTHKISYRKYATSRTTYYDTLEVTPKASAAQIKAAYYRLSKKYHPDVNKESDAKLKFSKLSEAYEILGNKRNRALYDQGLLSPSNISMSRYSPKEEMDKEYADFLKKHSTFRKRSNIPTGRTATYDFDEFYRQHYGDFVKQSFEKKQEQIRYEEEMRRRQEAEKLSGVVYLILLVVSVIAFTLKKIK